MIGRRRYGSATRIPTRKTPALARTDATASVGVAHRERREHDLAVGAVVDAVGAVARLRDDGRERGELEGHGALDDGREMRFTAPRRFGHALWSAEDRSIAPENTGLYKGKTIGEVVEAIEQRMIEEALLKAGGNKARAAEALGLSRQGLLKKIKRLAITR